MQTACGVDDDDIRAAGLRRRQRVEHDGAGVGTLAVLHYLGAGALGPDGELLCRSRAEGVPRREQDLFARVCQRQRRGKPAVARAYHHGVVVQSCQIISPYLSFNLWPYHEYIPAPPKLE